MNEEYPDYLKQIERQIFDAAHMKAELETEQCKHILQIIKGISLQATDDLKRVNVENTIGVIQLQQIAALYDLMDYGIRNILELGDKAEADLREEQEDGKG